ncbi:MAG: chromate resistance protein [Betaproteobacteria bacterium]|nr:chromate resistance protein [Betaproteobacteria bacterium]
MKSPQSPEDDAAQAALDGWLVLIASLPTENPPARMLILRTLESLGVAMLREGVYILPDHEDKRRAVAHLAEYVVKNDGSAQVFRARSLDAPQQGALRALFDRSARYEALVKVIEGLRLGFGVSDPAALARVLHKQRREYEAVAALDFFPSAARERAETALARAEAAIRDLLYPPSSAQTRAPVERLLRRSWATRRPLWADRLACAWLIRRFIDPEAILVWLDKGEPCPREALGFAFAGARFDNSEARVTFEEMLARFELGKNQALARIGAIVHFLEVQGTVVPEAAGVQTLLQGASRRSSSEDELLREAEKTFDLLYDAYYEPGAR